MDKLKILNKELQNINLMSKTHLTTLAGYAQKNLEIVNKLNHIFKYFYSNTKDTALRLYKEK